MKEKISALINDHISQLTNQDIMKLIEIPDDEKMGDFAFPCFAVAKLARESPVKIAANLCSSILQNNESPFLSKVEAVNGYVNFFIKREFYIQKIISEIERFDETLSSVGNGKVVCLDYSSPNIAKNFHVGHLRTTVIGNSLYKIYSKLGYKAIRINHLGDWGTQFGKLITAYKKWSSKDKIEENGIQELLRIYVKFNTEAEEDPHLNEEARTWFAKMEQQDSEALLIWEWFKEISLIDFKRVYDMLKIEFDYYTGESFYMDKIPVLVDELTEKNLLSESDGANVIDLSEYNMPPCLITKSDGSSIYHSRDIAAVLYRKNTYHFDKCIYVTGLEQSLHFKQVFKAIELMGYDWYTDLIHVPYGLVSLKGAKLSTRTGNIIYAEDILKEAITRAQTLVEEKSPNLSDKDTIASQVGIGAVIFHDLYNQRIKNIDFSWDSIINFDGNTGPYVQYTYARANSILQRNNSAIDKSENYYCYLDDDISYSLLKVLSKYADIVIEACERNEPSIISRYVISVATTFNKFYNDCNILNAEKEIKNARLILVDLTQKIILEAMQLLGIECPLRM